MIIFRLLSLTLFVCLLLPVILLWVIIDLITNSDSSIHFFCKWLGIEDE